MLASHPNIFFLTFIVDTCKLEINASIGQCPLQICSQGRDNYFKGFKNSHRHLIITVVIIIICGIGV
jgi:hypothetical protein